MGLHKSDLRFDFEKTIVINNDYFIFETYNRSTSHFYILNTNNRFSGKKIRSSTIYHVSMNRDRKTMYSRYIIVDIFVS